MKPLIKPFLNWSREYALVLSFAAAKLLMHLLTATNYGLQRDAYLYLAQSQRLDWGYFSTPPLLAVLTRIHTAVWGDSVLAIRLFPALVGTAGIFLVGWLIKQLKGGTMAQLIGLTAYLLSPAFLRPSVLLQPVMLNHLFWLLAALVVFQLIRKQDPRLLLWMIPVLGLGWLAKYSIIFYGAALLLALIISRHRRLLWSWPLPVALAGGLLVILPNLWWQYQHHWPVFSHMSELQETQLGNVLLKDFLFAQLFMHLPALPVWAGGLIWLFFNRHYREYRVFGWAFLITLLLIILLRGKFYYTIAAYTMLVVFGAIAWEEWARRSFRVTGKWRSFRAPETRRSSGAATRRDSPWGEEIQRSSGAATRRDSPWAQEIQRTSGAAETPRSPWAAGALILVIVVAAGVSVLPFSLPVYPPERMVQYDRKLIDMGLDVMLMWEDGEVRDLPQDYADMVGWDELGRKVWHFYDSLPDSVRSETRIYAESYGSAGAVLYHRPDDSCPGVYSFSDAFMEWIPRTMELRHLIYIGDSERLPLYFEELQLAGTVEHPHFRERGLPIWFGSRPTPRLYEDWEETWQQTAGRFTRE